MAEYLLENVSDEPSSIKKEAIKSDRGLAYLEATGYKIPSNWRNPHRIREFIGWDGEGITYPGQTQQSYCLFGASTGHTIVAPRGKRLSSSECFDIILEVERENPNAIHCGFSIQYDVNQWLADLPERSLWYLYRHNRIKWEGYRIEYYPGKWFTIRRGKTTARVFDVFGFFQTSFINACTEFLGSGDPLVEYIGAGKAARGTFQYDQMDEFVLPYWRTELHLLVRLMESLRKDLHGAGIYPSSWHGPGAVANSVFKQFNIKWAKSECPPQVNRAAQYGYAGGRFELFKAGHYPHPVWEYDIRSAYPSVIAGLPDLSCGSWEYTHTFQSGSFGIWYVRYDSSKLLRSRLSGPEPLFYRDRYGGVSFPGNVEGWYWTPEVENAIAYNPATQILGGWVFHSDSTREPFAFVREYYEKRAQWKREGNSAQRALKLALNSLYGKMAQRSGWQEGQPIPQWHQLEWAGYVTSATRAKLWQAILLAPSDIIATETDALFSSSPLNLPLSQSLGDWEETKFENITYIQSGLYYATTSDGEVLERYRGFDKGSLPYREVLAHLRNLSGDGEWTGELSPLCGYTTRFVGMGLGLRTKSTWRSWETSPRSVSFGGGGKRGHISRICPECREGKKFTDGLHSLAILNSGGVSEPHRLPWLNEEDPALRTILELEKW